MLTDTELTRQLAATTEPEPMAYVALATCGCIKMATVDTPARAQTNAKEIAACVRKGHRIEHVTCAWVREHWRSSCETCKPAKRRKAAPTAQGVLGI